MWFRIVRTTTGTYIDVVGAQDVFQNVVPTLTAVEGGCNHHTKTTLMKETPFYTFTLYNPVERNNNCGLRVLERVLGLKLNYSKIRKAFSLKPRAPITVDDLGAIYKSLGAAKMLSVIDESFNDDLNPNYN